MPTYSFHNKETDETFDKFMSISAKKDYLDTNPHIVQILTSAPGIVGDSVGLGVRRNDSGFNDLMHRIGKANPGSHVADKYVSRDSRQVKVDNVLAKHGIKKGGG